ncbi:hypothetical protein SDC9_184890 [bioreactor metagenome]|uniref:Uncharacterized protein n=1 Tax=bioreactor metagenome TaxID=1076179 RepID=A0A645HPS8_9ZZZZ
MRFVGGADEFIVGDAEPFPELLKAHHGFIAVALAVHAVFFGGALHLLAVLVGAGQEKGRIARSTMKARQHVAQHRGIGVADMRLVVDIINRSGKIKFFVHGAASFVGFQATP